MSKLVKCECINLDQANFVYGIPSSPKLGSGIESSPMQMVLSSDAGEQVRAIIDSANQYSAKMRAFSLKQAEETYENARQEGYRHGYKEGHEVGYHEGYEAGHNDGHKRGHDGGYDEGRVQVIAQNEQTLAQLVQMVETLDRDKEALLKQYEQEMVNLVLDMARKVVGAKLAQNDQAFINIFQNAVKGLREQKYVQLSVSWHEAIFATTNSDYLLGMIKDAERLEIHVLEDAPQGTCIIETDDVSIDASAGTQLDFIEKAIRATQQDLKV